MLELGRMAWLFLFVASGKQTGIETVTGLMIFAGLTSDFGPYWSVFAMMSGRETSQQTPCQFIFVHHSILVWISCCCDQVQSRQFCLRKSWQIWCKSWWILLPACRKGCVRIGNCMQLQGNRASQKYLLLSFVIDDVPHSRIILFGSLCKLRFQLPWIA